MERGHYIDISNTAYFRHDYDGEHADMRRLYEQAKIDQWNAATDIDWEKPLDTDGGLIADDLVDIHGSPFWERLSPRQRAAINRLPGRWALRALAHLDAYAWRARRDAGVQPVGRECRRAGRQAVSGDSGRRRGAAQ